MLKGLPLKGLEYIFYFGFGKKEQFTPWTSINPISCQSLFSTILRCIVGYQKKFSKQKHGAKECKNKYQ